MGNNAIEIDCQGGKLLLYMSVHDTLSYKNINIILYRYTNKKSVSVE